MSYLKNASDVSEIEALRRELEETGLSEEEKDSRGIQREKDKL